MLLSKESQNYVAGQVLVSVDVNGNVVALTSPNGAVINVPLINNSGTLAVPGGNAPVANQAFSPLSCIWQLAAKCATAATVTVSKVINNVTTAVGTINVPAGGVGIDYFEREYGATYKWSANTTGVTVEVL